MFGNIFFKIVRGMLQGVLAEQRATNYIVIEKSQASSKMYFLRGVLMDEWELTRQGRWVKQITGG